MKEDQVRFAAQAIRWHLANNPAAADTVEGIHDWWVGWSEPVPPRSVTQEALECLEREGRVKRWLLDSRELWGAGGA